LRRTVEKYLRAPQDRTVLQIIRHYCFSYANPATQSWEDGLVTAEVAFGPETGGAIAASTLRVLRAVRAARRSDFGFTNPYCNCCRRKLRNDEALLMGLVGAIRRGDRSGLQGALLILCEGASPGSLLREIEALADRIPSTPMRRNRMVFR
jgi:hypothetical protein